jgi:hypothetical protein
MSAIKAEPHSKGTFRLAVHFSAQYSKLAYLRGASNTPQLQGLSQFMKATSAARILACAALSVFFLGTSAARATDMQQLVQETQQMSHESEHLTLVWWIPQEFWEASLISNPNVTPAARKQMLSALEDYQIVALFRARAGINGLTEVPPKEEMLANAHFDLNGKAVEPLDVAKIGVGAQTLVATLKPLLGGMLGQLGQGMQLVVYPSKLDGKRLIDPNKPGGFQYTLYNQSFHWRLPLASLLPKKLDPSTKEEFPGNFDFNPYTGAKLISK